MKSSPEELQTRGYIQDSDIKPYADRKKKELISFLDCKKPHIRTIGARLLVKFPELDTIQALCNRLKNEKKLYTKIEITETLGNMGTKSLPFLINLLGSVGNNQYRSIPEKPFNKLNYPLPRDIIARTITKIGDAALPVLEKCLVTGNRSQILEALDAIGFIAFYYSNQNSLPYLWKILEKYSEDFLIMWKVIRAFESFPTTSVIAYLELLQKQKYHLGIQNEIKRSLNQITLSLRKIEKIQ